MVRRCACGRAAGALAARLAQHVLGGLDRLADELRARGIKAEVRRHLYWTTAVSDILRGRAEGNIGPLILVGHSQGGNDAIEIARALQVSHVPVDLVVTLAP
jgi:pimeloyl-ACP methyl ester carboxylesterase